MFEAVDAIINNKRSAHQASHIPRIAPANPSSVPPSRCGSCQLQIGHIRTSDEQDKPDNTHQDRQGSGKLASQLRQPSRRRCQCDLRMFDVGQLLRSRLRPGVLVEYLFEEKIGVAASLLHADARLAPGNDIE